MWNSKSVFYPGLIFALLFTATPTIARCQKDSDLLDAAAVRRAISDGVRALETDQDANGRWPLPKTMAQKKGGVTALCTLALLNASDDVDTPAIRKGLQAIISEKSLSTYFISLRVMCLATADPQGKKYLRVVQNDIQRLTRTQDKNGGWSYGHDFGGRPDSSNSQFALLALHAASRMGAVIEDDVWESAKKYWTSTRKKDGGYFYQSEGGGATRSMAAAGLASSIIIEENFPGLEGLFANNRIQCCGKSSLKEDHQKQTADFIGNSFRTGGGKWQYYFLYGLERAGRLSGRRFFGTHDWYREGASRLLKLQIDGGAWRGSGQEKEHIATSMALLFLSKGKRPVAIGKYLFETEDDNLHQSGVHYLTRNIEKAWNQKLNWQEVKGSVATADDLLESPVIFMSGNRGFVMSDFQKDALKKYLENGGFLFADACQGDGCGDADFEDSFRSLMGELFPDSPLERLPMNHPVWNSHYQLDRSRERPLLGLRACCKTSVIFSPRNLSCFWNVDRSGVERKMKAAGAKYDRLLGDIKYATKVGVNVTTYATGRDLKEKGARPKLAAKAKSVLTGRSLELPKLIHDGGHDEAPNAWRNLQKRYATSGNSVNLEKIFVNVDLDQLSDYPFLFVHGRRSFSFSEEERLILKSYLFDLNGFIFADSICSSKEFTASFREEMTKIVGQPLKPIPASHPIWKDGKILFRIDSVTRRRQQGDTGKFDELKGPPELEGHTINDRLAVVFSQHDLSCALESSTVSQCDGYTREDAERIGINVLLYRLRVE